MNVTYASTMATMSLPRVCPRVKDLLDGLVPYFYSPFLAW